MTQEFDNEVLDLIKQKGLYLYKHMCGFDMFNETLSSKADIDSSLSGAGISAKNYLNMFSKFGINFKWKRWEPITVCN